MYHFILNPNASSGKGKKAFDEIKPILVSRNIDYRFYIFENRDELAETVSTLSSSTNATVNHIVVVGGDGTLNLVLNYIEDFTKVKLSVLRVGSGNDFARNVGVGKDIKKYLIHLLDEPEIVELDYGVAEYITEDGEVVKRRFIISSGIGYDADICEEASRSRLKKVLNNIKLGKLVYLLIGLKQVFIKKGAKAIIYFDNGRKIRLRSMFFAVGMVHKMEGGGVPFCPYADPLDGKLDVCVVKSANVFKLLLEVGLVYIKKHLIFSNITNYRCRSYRVALSKPEWIHLDGETPCKVKGAKFTSKSGIRFVR